MNRGDSSNVELGLTEQFFLTKIEQSRSLDNYIIHDYPKNTSGRCLVCFSSNGLYYPNTDYELDRVITENKFEWSNFIDGDWSRVILLRDTYKQWYFSGINKTMNSIDKLAAFITEITSGYQSIFIGSSAGGYAAVLFGRICHAKSIISFNGQFDLKSEALNPRKNKILFENSDSTYINISNLIFDNVFYFMPAKSEQDCTQLSFLEGKRINRFSFNSKLHGIPFYSFSIRKIIGKNEGELLNILTNKPGSQSSFVFSLIHLNPRDLLLYLLYKSRKLLSLFPKFFYRCRTKLRD